MSQVIKWNRNYIQGETFRFGNTVRYIDLLLSDPVTPEGSIVYLLLGDINEDQKITGTIHGIDSDAMSERSGWNIDVISDIQQSESTQQMNVNYSLNRASIGQQIFVELVQVEYFGNTYGAVKVLGSNTVIIPRNFYFTGYITGSFKPIVAQPSEISNESAWVNSHVTSTGFISDRSAFKGLVQAPYFYSFTDLESLGGGADLDLGITIRRHSTYLCTADQNPSGTAGHTCLIIGCHQNASVVLHTIHQDTPGRGFKILGTNPESATIGLESDISGTCVWSVTRIRGLLPPEFE